MRFDAEALLGSRASVREVSVSSPDAKEQLEASPCHKIGGRPSWSPQPPRDSHWGTPIPRSVGGSLLMTEEGAGMVLYCEECGCCSERGKGWIAETCPMTPRRAASPLASQCRLFFQVASLPIEIDPIVSPTAPPVAPTVALRP